MNAQVDSSEKPHVVLFTGAGFAADAGAPVMKEFQSHARKSTLLSCTTQDYIEAGFYFTGYSMSEEPNLETAFGAMAFRQLLHPPDFQVAFCKEDGFVPKSQGPTIEEVIEAFERAISIIYGRHVLDQTSQWLDDYSRFFSYLLDHFRLTVVTTNYDLVTETALRKLNCRASYRALKQRASEDVVPILKLHGSVNWPKEKSLDLARVRTDAPPLDRAYVLPPTWNKDLTSNSPFAKVWKDALDLIEKAEAVLLIGHSFPRTDLHLDFLLGEALAKRVKNPKFKHVTIVDQDPCTACKVCKQFQRYQMVELPATHAIPFSRLLTELEAGTIVL